MIVVKLQVLIDESGNVLGTAHGAIRAVEGEGPEQAGLQAAPGQYLIEVEVEEGMVEASAAELQAHIKATLIG
ncbi:hypothetical protein [Streptomyces sp. NPDC054863]